MEYVFNLGGFGLRWYSAMVVLGIVAGAWTGRIEARRRGEDPGHVFNALLWAVPLALVGARAYHVLDQWGEIYSRDPARVLLVSEGGFGIFGAIAGGAIGLAVYARLKGLAVAQWLDIGAPGLILGQAIGRWGNFFNEELYGRPTGLPWGITIPQDNRLLGYERYDSFHPLFFYEFALDLLALAALVLAGRRWRGRLKEGDLALAYGLLYGVIRLGLENLRIGNWRLGGVPTADIVGACLILGCGGALLYRHWWGPRAESRKAAALAAAPGLDPEQRSPSQKLR